MERRKLLVGGTVFLLAVLLLSGSATARSTRRHTVKPTTTTEETCSVHALPGSFMDQGEFGTASSVADVVEVECQPVYAEHFIEFSAQELYSRCAKSLSWATPPELRPGDFTGPTYFAQLDNDGNAVAVLWGGPSCAAGESLISAHLIEAPYTTVTTGFTVLPPRPTTPGVRAEPEKAFEDEFTSSVATIVEVEFPPVYAEQPVNINASQLFARCHGPGPRLEWAGPDQEILGLGEEVAEKVWLDNDGNAFVVLLAGTSCAAGQVLIEASLEDAPYTTYTNIFEVEPPQPTI